MNTEQSLDSLWQRLQTLLRPTLSPVPTKKVRSPSPHLRLTQSRKPRLRNFALADDELKYGIPIDKYSSLLLSERPYQTHILCSEFGLLAEKLRLFAEDLKEKPKEKFAQLDTEEQADFNTKLERTLGRLRELLDYMQRATYDEHLRRVRTYATLPGPIMVLREHEVFAENVSLLLATARDFQTCARDYVKRVKVQRHLTLSLEACQSLLKLLSQVRLSLSYLSAESTSHDETLRRQKLMAKGSWSPHFKKRFVSPMQLPTKDFALHMLGQKSVRSLSPLRTESPKTQRAPRTDEDDKFSNFSNLYLETAWRKGQNLRRPSSKCRLTRDNRVEKVLDRALNSSNPAIANSVRQLMAKFQSTSKKTLPSA